MLCCELCVCASLPIMDTGKEFKTSRTRSNPIYCGGVIINFESMNQGLFSNKENCLAPYKGIQAIFGKWNLDSGFQSLMVPDSLSSIPDCKAQDFRFHKQNISQILESGFSYMGRIVIFTVFDRYSATSCVKPH